jgi:hypothetical protein
MLCIILSSAIFLALLNFSTLSNKRHNFALTFFNIKCVVWFLLQRLTKKFHILRTGRDKYRLFLSYFNKTRLLSTDFRKMLKYQIHEIRLQRAELFHADRQTVKTKLLVALRKFAKAPKNTATRFTSIANSEEQNCLFSHFASFSAQILQQQELSWGYDSLNTNVLAVSFTQACFAKGPKFKYSTVRNSMTEVFVFFINLPGKSRIAPYPLKLGFHCILLHPFKFTVHCSFHHPALWNVI